LYEYPMDTAKKPPAKPLGENSLDIIWPNG
jgi:hypothetical protein